MSTRSTNYYYSDVTNKRQDYPLENMDRIARPCCVPDYHIEMWGTAAGEVLLHCEREPTNLRDSYAAAVIKDGIIIGHLHRKIVGGRRSSADILQHSSSFYSLPCFLQHAVA